MSKNSLDTMSFALAAGTFWGLSVLLMGIAAWQFDLFNEIVTFCGKYYKGYEANFSGSIIGTIWGFADGFIGGYILAWLYNYFQKKRKT